MQSRDLVIYGSFGAAGLHRHINDWSNADVVEMDALMPDHSGASKALEIEVSSHSRAARINQRTRHLLDIFLLDRGESKGLEVSRDFRAACLSLDAWRVISPYLLNLEIARELAQAPKWSRVIVSPGAGISLLAWQQFAEHLGIPIQVLPIAPHRPPLLWTLRRKWQRWRSQKSPAKASSLTQPLPAARPDSQFLCADPRLRALLTGSDWHQLPELVRPTSEEQVELVERYQRWWDSWWAEHRASLAQSGLNDDTRILEPLGRHFSRNIYPQFAPLLAQARAKLATFKPRAILSGAMRGKKELMYVLAARERGIPSGAVTLDDAIDPRLSIGLDFAFCDDARHRELAQKRGVSSKRTLLMRSPRMPTLRSERHPVLKPGQKARIIMADTFFIGAWLAAMPLAGLWTARLVIEVARQMPEHDFVIKLHPVRERPEEKFAWTGFHHLHLWHRERGLKALSPPKNVHIVQPETRLSELLENAHLLLNIESYASYEAFALGIPVIHLAKPCSTLDSLAELTKEGADQYVSRAEDLAKLIKTNIHDEGHIIRQTAAQQEFIKRMFPVDVPHLADFAQTQFATS